MPASNGAASGAHHWTSNGAFRDLAVLPAPGGLCVAASPLVILCNSGQRIKPTVNGFANTYYSVTRQLCAPPGISIKTCNEPPIYRPVSGRYKFGTWYLFLRTFFSILRLCILCRNLSFHFIRRTFSTLVPSTSSSSPYTALSLVLKLEKTRVPKLPKGGGARSVAIAKEGGTLKPAALLVPIIFFVL